MNWFLEMPPAGLDLKARIGVCVTGIGGIIKLTLYKICK